MIRSRWGSSVLGRAALVGALCACDGTHTGNPGKPDGAEFVRSSLELETDPEVSDDELAQLTRDNRDFAFDLYRELAATRAGQNLSLSPYSISAALAMTYAGAGGETQSQMATALHFALPEPALHRAFNATAQELQQRGEQLSIINAAFTDKDTEFHAAFLDVLALNYDAGMYLLDFGADPNAARESINDWVSEKTRERVQDLLPAGAIDSNTAFVLANAVHFKADWAAPFDLRKTNDRPFHAPDGDVTVKMMTDSDDHEYAEGDGYQAVALPFEPDALRMLFILPGAGRFDEVEGKLDRALLDEVEQGLSAAEIGVSMPRFRFESAFALKDGLAALGMPDAFSSVEADFSRMTDSALYLTSVHHKTFVALAENGVEAAAATAVVGGSKGVISTPPPSVVFDRPFFFAIYDQPTGQLLFLGRVSDPS